MASTFKSRQKKQLKQDLQTAAQTITRAVNPRIKPTGTYPAAQKTVIRTTLDIPRKSKPVKLIKKKKRKK